MSFQDSGQNAHSSSKKETKETRTIDVPIIAKSLDLANLKKSESGVQPTPNLSFQQTFTAEDAEVLKQPESVGEALQIFKALFAPLPTLEERLKRFQEFADKNPAAALPLLELKRLQTSTIKASENLDAWFNEREKAIAWAGLMEFDVLAYLTRPSVGEALGVDSVNLIGGYEWCKNGKQAEAQEKEVRNELGWTNPLALDDLDKGITPRICDEFYNGFMERVNHPADAHLNSATICGNLNLQKLVGDESVKYTYAQEFRGKALSTNVLPAVQGTQNARDRMAMVVGAVNYKVGDNHIVEKRVGKKDKIRKYHRPKNSPHGAFIPYVADYDHYDRTKEIKEDEEFYQRVIEDGTYPILYPEGEMSSLSVLAASKGKIAAIALSGVTMSHKPQTKEIRAELTQIPHTGRPSYICFDSDKWKVDEFGNQQIRQAELTLAATLHDLAARVRMINLAGPEAVKRRKAAPLHTDRDKFGIDDHLACFAEGDRMAELLRLMDESEIYTPVLVLKANETVEDGVARLWEHEIELVAGRVIRYAGDQWYEQTAPRIYQALKEGGAVEVKCMLKGILTAIQKWGNVKKPGNDLVAAQIIERLKEGAKEVNGYMLISARLGSTFTRNNCFPQLQLALKTTFEYDPHHLTFSDGQVMELSTGRLIDGSALPPTIHALPFVYKPTEFNDLPQPVRELFKDRFTPENLLLARAVLRYAFDRADDSHKKGYAIQLLAESDGGKSVLMQVIKACKPSNDMTAKLPNFNGMAADFFISETIGRGQDVLIVDDVACIPKGCAQTLYSLVSDEEKQMKTKFIQHAVPVPRNVCVVFAGTAVVTPSDASNRTGFDTRSIILQLQPLPEDKDTHRTKFFAPVLRDKATKIAYFYAIGCWALGMSRAEMSTVLEKAASSPEKKAMLNEETQVGRFIRDCLSPMPTEFGVDCLTFEREGLKRLSDPTYGDDEKVKFRRLMAEGGVAESFLWPVYKAWVDEVGRSKHRLSRDTFISELRGLLKDKLKIAGKNEKVWSGKESQRVRDSYVGLWLAGEHNPFLSLFPHLSPEPVLYEEDGKRFNAELMNSV